MVTTEQIKAARAMLDWSQEDLAKFSGVSSPAIKNLERRNNKPRAETLNAIKAALEDAGIEFLGEVGVKLRGENLKVRVFEGHDALYRLLNDIFDSLVGTKNELLIAGVSETIHKKEGGEKFLELIRKRSQHGIKSKLLAREGDTDLVDAKDPHREYRWISDELFSQVPYYIYGNKYAIMLFGKPQKVVLIENKQVADSYRKQFMTQWKTATKTK
jgi:transcriptional regulator with XRE-family HTH domain